MCSEEKAPIVGQRKTLTDRRNKSEGMGVVEDEKKGSSAGVF